MSRSVIFSASSWGDGIDPYSTKNVIVQNVFIRTSDDCIAIYNHRNHWYGNSTNIMVSDSSLWVDVAHQINLATHGNLDDPETLSDLTICNIGILDHREPRLDYQGCIAINPGDDNTVRMFSSKIFVLRISDLASLSTCESCTMTRHNSAPGRLILNLPICDMIYNGNHSNPSLILGYDEEGIVEFVTFEHLTIKGLHIADDMQKHKWYLTSDTIPMYVNEHVMNLTFTCLRNHLGSPERVKDVVLVLNKHRFHSTVIVLHPLNGIYVYTPTVCTWAVMALYFEFNPK